MMALPFGVSPFPEGIEAEGSGGEQPPAYRVRVSERGFMNEPRSTYPFELRHVSGGGFHYVAFERRLT